ncbi:mannosyl-oligosaccharide alpha-1,2-mannosidase, partial [Achlya hypogyna]
MRAAATTRKRLLLLLGAACLLVLAQLSQIRIFSKDHHRGALRGERRKVPRPPLSAEEAALCLNFSDEAMLTRTQSTRRTAIKSAMTHAWRGYETYAFGADEVGPVSGRRRQNVWGDISVTLVDALDTLYIMGMMDEFNRARDWVAYNLDFTHLGTDGDIISIFEVTIRELGGLLGAYAVSRDPAFLARAVEFADLTAPAFDEAKGIFYTEFNPYTKARAMHRWTRYRGLLADLGTLQLEMRYLSDITGDPQYARRGDAFYEIVQREGSYKNTGLFPVHYDPETGAFAQKDSFITIGALGDSFYEYLLKVFIYSGKNMAKDAFLRATYDAAVDGIEKHLLSEGKAQDADGTDVTYHYLKVLSIPGLGGTNEQDHLLCFVPGMLALGTVGETDAAKVARHLDMAKKLMRTCYAMYSRQVTGLAPDLVGFPGFVVQSSVYHLRPETIESLMYLARVTKDPKYREWGWRLFEALEKHAKTTYGYGAVWNVDSLYWTKVEDKMESFFMAET